MKPLIQSMTFTCTRCGGDQEMRFSEGIYNPPTSCGLDGCRSKSFKPQKNTAQSIDWQKIRIQVGCMYSLLKQIELLQCIAIYYCTGCALPFMEWCEVITWGEVTSKHLILLAEQRRSAVR